MMLDKLYLGDKGKIAYILVQRRLLEKQKLDLRIILLGGYTVGKSTLVSLLINRTDGSSCGR